MKLQCILSTVFTLAPVFAILPEAQIALKEDRNQPGPQSLPNLMTVANVEELELNWEIKGSMALEAGRLLVDSETGSLWSRKLLENSKDEWTIDLVFRNSEQVDVDDHSFYDTNGISFWLLDSDSPFDTDVLNFGGPKSFDGFQFLMNNKESRGLKIFSNDGSKSTENTLDQALGFCAINYLDSMVPFTLRISYSAPRKWFKIQIDNNLCFKTELLSFNEIKKDLKFGISASTDQKSKEYWEVLKLNVYPYLTEDAIDDHGIIADGGVKYITVTQDEESTETFHPSTNRLSLLERARKMKEEILSNSEKPAAQDSSVDNSLATINSKLTVLEEMMNQIDAKKMDEFSKTLEEVKIIQNEQVSILNHMKNTYGEFETLLNVQYKEMNQAVVQLHQKMLDEIKSHQKEVLNIGDKVDLLMTNHKEIQEQYRNNEAVVMAPESSELFSVIIKWVLFPIVVGIAVLSVILYRIRKDIKHSKLL